MKSLGALLTIYVHLLTCHILAQTTGDLRLTSSTSQLAGRLEIFLFGGWGTVCADDFDFYEGDIACRQLGFLYADRVGTVGELGFAEGTGSIWLDEVRCSSSDSRLADCEREHTPFKCSHEEDVALRCSNTANQLRLISQTNRTANLSAGRLEIFINNQWGTVCGNGFEIADANVACRQMGYSEAVAYGSANSLGYPSRLPSGPIWMDDLSCPHSIPTLSNLRECPHLGTGRHNCDHSKDVILSCLANGTLRLIGESVTSTRVLSPTGRLEIYLNGQWGTVCDDLFQQTEADVACRQLGYGAAIEYGNHLGPAATASSRIWLDDVVCSSLDVTLLSCQHPLVGVHNCIHFEDVGLSCGQAASATGNSSPSSTDPEGGSSSSITWASTTVFSLGLIVCCLICIPAILTRNNQHRSSESPHTPSYRTRSRTRTTTRTSRPRTTTVVLASATEAPSQNMHPRTLPRQEALASPSDHQQSYEVQHPPMDISRPALTLPGACVFLDPPPSYEMAMATASQHTPRHLQLTTDTTAQHGGINLAPTVCQNDWTRNTAPSEGQPYIPPQPIDQS